MNGYSLLTTAARLLGIAEQDETVKVIGLAVVNAALCDIGLSPLCSLSEMVICGKNHQALIFGTALFLASALGFEEGKKAMKDAYQQERARVKGGTAKVRDTLPKGDW